MSTISVYCIPSKQFPVGRFANKAERILKKLNIIDGYYDEDEGTYATSGRIPFEYASIHDTDKIRLIPAASSVGYAANCPHCDSGIDEIFYDIINDHYEAEEDAGEEANMHNLSVVCKNCNQSTRLDKLKYNQPTAFTNQFFEFIDIENEIDPVMVKKLESKLCCKLQLIYERM